METYPIVIGTAGHIDHGKTALVHVLTGIDTDRLKVEKERGITTELGFAYLDLEGRRYGVVDVPGHERFIKAMVSGAAGLDLVVLVIAADEGIMPQTREHLDVCELLGVRRGVVALTKRDLVDDEWLELVTADVREGLAGSFLADASIIPVSARTGRGLDELRREFVRIAGELEARPDDGVLRLPLDRVFTIKGFGTVVTGTLIGGHVRVGDAVVLQPGGVRGKVRGVEVHGESTEVARAGSRCAVNLAGVSREDAERGDVLSHPDAIVPSHLIDARFRYLDTSRDALGRRNRVLLHHGTRQVMASLVLVDRDSLAPGETALVQLRLDRTTPLAALPGDRFIARGFVIQAHYGTTIGGGEILRVHAPKVRRSAEAGIETVKRIAEARDAERVALEIRGAHAATMSPKQLAQRLGLPEPELDDIVTQLVEAGDVVRCETAGGALTYCHAEPFAELEERALAYVDRYHADHPRREGVPREELRAQLPRAMPPALFEQVMSALERRRALMTTRDAIARPRHAERVRRNTALDGDIDRRYAEWALTPPKPGDVATDMGADPADARASIDRLLTAGTLVKVKADLLVHRSAMDRLREQLLAHLDANGEITPAEWKSITGASRKYSIPLAEHFDGEKVTLRVGDVRKRRG